MLDEVKTKSRLGAPAKLIGASVLAVLLGIGLCSVGHFNLEGQSSPLANVGVFLFFAGIFGGFIGIIWLIVAAAMGPRVMIGTDSSPQSGEPPSNISKGDG